ncbi:hypothetical protein CJP72_14380 [Citrobacter sp. NCU1]|uniref:hypothetical protein n=1 Tax=Citrobacter sp. NCU1 TaxID=2026683 RepID=UPI0013920C8A|nr:hypothetical protein [Citrobacter sp. NCU1]NDO81909.1 hypothetical protein [Citrobacter sp. NCU1]
MKRYRYYNFCTLPYLFLVLFFSGMTFADEKPSVVLEFDQNNNCTTENGIVICKVNYPAPDYIHGVTVGSASPGGVVDSRKNDGDKDLQRFKLAPNDSIGMLKDDFNSKDLRAEMGNKMLNEGGKY